MQESDMDAPNPHTDEELEAAYGAGYNACHDMQPLTTNPHPKDSLLAQVWASGWRHYDADYNPDYYSSLYMDDL